jgi:hypothetical protein
MEFHPVECVLVSSPQMRVSGAKDVAKEVAQCGQKP